MLVGLDLGRAADAADDAAVVIERAAMIGARTGILGIDAAVGDRADGRAAGLVFLVFVRAGQAAVGALPEVRVIPPEIAVEDRVALDIALHIGRRCAEGIDLGRVGVGGKGAVIQLGNDSAVMNRILADRHRAVLDQIDRTGTGHVVALRDGVAAAHVAVIDAVGRGDGAAVHGADMAAVVEDRVAARREQSHMLQRRDRRPVVHDDRGIAVDVLGILQRNVGNAHRTAGEVADDRGVVRNARVADGVGEDAAATGAVLHRQRAAVGDCGHALIGGGSRRRAGMIIPGAAVELQGHRALVDQTADRPVSVEINGQIRRLAVGKGGRRAFLFEGTAVRDQPDRAGAELGHIRHSGSQRGIILVGKAVIGDRTGVEAEDVRIAAARFADRDKAFEGIAAGRRNAAQIPYDAVVVVGRHAHLLIGRRCKGFAHGHRRRSFLHHVICLAVDLPGFGKGIAGKELIVLILLLIEDKGRDEFRRGAGQGNDRVGGDVADVDVRSADAHRRGAGSHACAEAGQPAGVIAHRRVVFAVVARADRLVVVDEIDQEAVPVLAVLVVIPGARPGVDSGGIAVVAVVEPRRGKADRRFVAVVQHLIDRRGRCRRRAEDDSAAAALRALRAGDVAARVGGEERACDRDGAVDVQQRILQAGGRTDCRRSVRDGVADRIHPGAAGEVEPVGIIVQIDFFPAVDRQRGIPTDLELHAGQHFDVLRYRGRAALQVDADVAGNRENVIARCNTADYRQARQGHRGDGDVAADFNVQPVCGLLIVLDDIAAADSKHAARANEGRGHRISRAGSVDGGIQLFGGTGMDFQRDFDILNIILVEDEGILIHV